MMMLTTQTRILLTEWKALAQIIATHSITSQEKPIMNIEELESFDIENLENITFSMTEELPHILSEKQISAVLQGPFGAHLRQKMAAYAKAARFRLELHLNKEEIFKNKRLSLPPEEQLSPKKLLKLTFSDLDKIQSELDSLTEQHDAQWKEFIEEWTNKLAEYLAASGVLLTERENRELQEESIAPELLPRFIDVGMKLPKKDYPEMNFLDYLHLKAILALQSALSRQHLAHTESDIENILKNFKSEFTLMEKQEKNLLEEQKEMVQEVLQPLN